MVLASARPELPAITTDTATPVATVTLAAATATAIRADAAVAEITL